MKMNTAVKASLLTALFSTGLILSLPYAIADTTSCKIVMGTIRSTFVVDETGSITLPLYNVKATGHVASLRKKLGFDA